MTEKELSELLDRKIKKVLDKFNESSEECLKSNEEILKKLKDYPND